MRKGKKISEKEAIKNLLINPFTNTNWWPFKITFTNFQINFNFSCYTTTIADRLLQQCLVPVVPNARELNMGAW